MNVAKEPRQSPTQYWVYEELFPSGSLLGYCIVHSKPEFYRILIAKAPMLPLCNPQSPGAILHRQVQKPRKVDFQVSFEGLVKCCCRLLEGFVTEFLESLSY